VVSGILFVIISLFLVLQIPQVQQAILDRFLSGFSGSTHFITTTRSFHIYWFDRMEIEGLKVIDPENNPMIDIGNALVNYSLTDLLSSRDIHLDALILDSTHVYLKKIHDADSTCDLNINIFLKAINALSAGEGGGKPPRINLGEAVINQSRFTYIDPTRDSIAHGFNYNQFSLDLDEVQLNNFVVLGDTIEFNVRTLIAEDRASRFRINQLSTFFRISQASLEFTGLDLQAGKSVIRDSVVFTYESQLALNNFVEEVDIHAHLENSLIYPEDLEMFAYGARQINKPLTMNGDIHGRISKMSVDNMRVSIGDTELNGSLNLDGLPNTMETFIILNLRDSRVRFEDFDFLLSEQAVGRMKPVGTMRFNGQFLGYPTDFVANGTIHSNLGIVKTDINIKIDEENFDRSTYAGRVSAQNFHLGSFLNDTINFQRVTLDGSLRGKGLTIETADFSLNGSIPSFGIRGYNYSNIKTNARFAAEFFNGSLSIDDPNLRFSADGSVDLRKNINQLKIRMNLDTANFHNLNLSKKELRITGRLDLDLTGLSLDTAVGRANVNNLFVAFDKQSMALKKVEFFAERSGNDRRFDLKTTLLDFTIEGNYRFTRMYNDAERLVNEMLLHIRNDRQEINEYYATQRSTPDSYLADFELRLYNLAPITALLSIDMDLSQNTAIAGTFTSGHTSILQVHTSFDTLRYQQQTLYNTHAEVSASKISDSSNVLAVAYLESEQQELGRVLKTRNLIAEAVWDKHHIDFQVDCDQQGRTNYIQLQGDIDLLRDSTLVHFQPSKLFLLERTWSFNPSHRITLKKKHWAFENLELQNDFQSLTLDGIISKNEHDTLDLVVDNLDLRILNVITKERYTGTLNATVNLSQYFGIPSIENDLTVDSLTINEFLVGDVSGTTDWDSDNEAFLINLFVDRLNKRTVKLSGFYTPREKRPLDLTAELSDANLKVLEPYLTDIFSTVDGKAAGSCSITGTLASPEIEGEVRVDNGKVTIGYTNTPYSANGIVGFRKNQLYFRDMELLDTYKSKGTFRGTIYHKNFHGMVLDLHASIRGMQVLNTSAKDNELFYGQGYATGQVSITGPVSNLNITAAARTDKNTRIFIPIGGTSSNEQKDFINFVSFTDSTQTTGTQVSKKGKVKLTGISFDLNLDVTPDAYCELIIDLKAGDIIRGRGNGDLKIQVDTKGEFNMFGPLEFTEGWYNFTLYDIINKEFEIQKGSQITWYGDPYGATLDIRATYNQLASFSPLVTDPEAANSPELRRKYPVQVLLDLDGPMLSPLIVFDILARDLPKTVNPETNVSLDFLFQTFKNKLDEQELKRQVFSLIVLRKFSPMQAFDVSTGETVWNSVSELLSNQLSYWMSQVDENLEIDVDLGTMDQESLNTFQLRLSYTFFNGRLRVTGDGTYNNYYDSNPNSKSNPNAITGDWAIDYFLTADGKFKVRMYSRTNYNQLATSVNNQNYLTTGVSLQHVQSFNTLKELLNFRKKEEDKTKAPKEAEKTKAEGIREEDEI
jgi:hypothetical protein